MKSNEEFTVISGVDIIGFGPIGRELATRLASDEELRNSFGVNSISDSSGRIFPSKTSDVLKAVEWKKTGHKLSDFQNATKSSGSVKSSIVVDVTNSDYGKADEARQRATNALNSAMHFVSANKVALSNYYSEILDLARSRNLRVGLGATICGGKHAISVAEKIPHSEIQSTSAVLNASTTLILSTLEEDREISFEEACKKAAESGVLESDWSIDLDGIDAAAKTSILANTLYPKSGISLKNIARRGIRNKEAQELIQSQRRKAEKSEEKIRLVSEITEKKTSVEPKLLPKDSPLAVSGRFNAVSFETKSLGQISVRNLGGGVALTVSVIVSDLKEIAE